MRLVPAHTKERIVANNIVNPRPPRLLVTAREAADLLAISPRTLWTLTSTGEIACVRIGRSVRYDVADLRVWIGTHKTGAAT